MRRAADEADIYMHRITLSERHVLDQQAQHALFVLHLRAGIPPEAWEVAGESHQLRALSIVDDIHIGRGCFLVRFLCGGDRPQLRVPFRFEHVSYQTVVGIDLEEATLRELRFVFRPLHVLPAKPVGLFLTACEFLLHAQRHFDRERRHRLDEDIADRRIECAAVYRLAQTDLASVRWATAAPIGRYLGVAMRMITHRHAFPAG